MGTVMMSSVGTSQEPQVSGTDFAAMNRALNNFSEHGLGSELPFFPSSFIGADSADAQFQEIGPSALFNGQFLTPVE